MPPLDSESLAQLPHATADSCSVDDCIEHAAAFSPRAILLVGTLETLEGIVRALVTPSAPANEAFDSSTSSCALARAMLIGFAKPGCGLTVLDESELVRIVSRWFPL